MNELAPASHQLQTINADLLARFVAFLDVKPRTVDTYSKSIKQFFAYMAERQISNPTREDVIAYRDHLKATGHKPATIQCYIIAVRQFFKWTEAEGITSKNPAANIKGARISREFKKDPLTTRQTKAVMSAIDRSTEDGARDYAIIATMTTGGLRTVEIIRADIEDLRNLGDVTVLYIQGKGHDEKGEFIKVPAPVEIAIRDYLRIRGAASGPLFASFSHRNQGERMTTRSVSRIVKQSMRAAGLNSDRLTAHSLRHTAATLNLMNGGTLEQTQQLLRHAHISTTQIYAHHLDRMKNNSENRIASAIF